MRWNQQINQVTKQLLSQYMTESCVQRRQILLHFTTETAQWRKTELDPSKPHSCQSDSDVSMVLTQAWCWWLLLVLSHPHRCVLSLNLSSSRWWWIISRMYTSTPADGPRETVDLPACSSEQPSSRSTSHTQSLMHSQTGLGHCFWVPSVTKRTADRLIKSQTPKLVYFWKTSVQQIHNTALNTATSKWTLCHYILWLWCLWPLTSKI